MTPATRPGIRTAAAARRQPRQAGGRAAPARPSAAASSPRAPMRKGANPMRDAPSVTDLVTHARNGDKPARSATSDLKEEANGHDH